jgi:competence protein ComEC
MSDRAAVVVALAVAVGAWWAAPVPRLVGVVAVTAALVARRPALLAVGGLLLAAGLAHVAWAGLEPPQPTSVTARAVTLVTDPEVDGGEVTAVIRLDGRRLEAQADDGPEAATFAAALAGERPVLSGRIVPVTGRPDLAVRHVAGRLVVDVIGPVGAADPVSTVANHLRRAVVRGAQPLGEEATALLTGILFGDDRAQPPATTDDFRAAGLSHLLAVSGQNVAFVLVVAGVGLGRLGLGSRFLAVLLVLAFFALLTRFEPSVLRATAMAAVAAGATFGGRAVSRPRVLALAVAALLLVDPILVHSVGFGLSVAATAGIVVLAARLETRLPGPATVRESAAVTLAAQVAVAPLLATVFGGVPLVSVPANLLAGPAAGFVMVWGLLAGPIAGFVPLLAPALHLPTGVALGWLDLVARGAAATPLGELRAPHLVVLAAAALAVHGRPALRRPAVVVILAVLVTPGLVLARQVPLTGRAVATGAQVWRHGGAVVVRLDGRARAAPVLEGLRRLGVRRAGLVLLTASSPSAEATAAAVATRGSAAVVGPEDDPPSAGEGLRQGPFAVEAMTVSADRVQWLVRVDPASVRSADVRGARSPPLRHHPSGPGHGDPQPDA